MVYVVQARYVPLFREPVDEGIIVLRVVYHVTVHAAQSQWTSAGANLAANNNTIHVLTQTAGLLALAIQLITSSA